VSALNAVVRSCVSAADAEEKVLALRSPVSYAHEVKTVEVIETHFAWVFLAGEYAYKLKKCTCSARGDLRSLKARRLSCKEEVRVNRRLAPDVYLGVIPLVQAIDRRMRVGGEGMVVDWLVHMRRLDSESMLDRAISGGTALPSRLAAVGFFLAQFYQTQPRVALQPVDYISRIAGRIRTDEHALLAPELQLDDELVRASVAETWRAFAVMQSHLAHRARQGRIVECHGDLRPEHISLADPPCVIDALEFSRDLRTLDSAEELAFLWIECELAKGEQAAAYVLEAYCRSSRDMVSERLLDFYRSRRAMVRAKILAWHVCDEAVMNLAPWREHAYEYLRVSQRYADRVVGAATARD
jgi:uncharacterized protein